MDIKEKLTNKLNCYNLNSKWNELKWYRFLFGFLLCGVFDTNSNIYLIYIYIYILNFF